MHPYLALTGSRMRKHMNCHCFVPFSHTCLVPVQCPLLNLIRCNNVVLSKSHAKKNPFPSQEPFYSTTQCKIMLIFVFSHNMNFHPSLQHCYRPLFPRHWSNTDHTLGSGPHWLADCFYSPSSSCSASDRGKQGGRWQRGGSRKEGHLLPKQIPHLKVLQRKLGKTERMYAKSFLQIDLQPFHKMSRQKVLQTVNYQNRHNKKWIHQATQILKGW